MEEEEENLGDVNEEINNDESLSAGENNEVDINNDVNDTTSDGQEKINNFNFILTNARSLAPKIDSFLENFNERDIDLAVVTETWLYEGSGLLNDCLLYTSDAADE